MAAVGLLWGQTLPEQHRLGGWSSAAALLHFSKAGVTGEQPLCILALKIPH